jgi:cell division protease FtsH
MAKSRVGVDTKITFKDVAGVEEAKFEPEEVVLPGVGPIFKVSIIPRSVDALGDTIQRPMKDRFLPVESDLKNRLPYSWAAARLKAEGLIFAGSVSPGAAMICSVPPKSHLKW